MNCKSRKREILPQAKVRKTWEYFVYFLFFELNGWGERSAFRPQPIRLLFPLLHRRVGFRCSSPLSHKTKKAYPYGVCLFGAPEGTRTHTLSHGNLNPACLPIPSQAHAMAFYHKKRKSQIYVASAPALSDSV